MVMPVWTFFKPQEATMIVLAQDYDTLDRNDAAKAGLSWPLKFGTDALELEKFAESEREIIKGLMCLPAQIPTGQQLFAVVSVVNLRGNRFGDGTWPTFASQFLPRTKSELGIDHHLVQLHYVSADGTNHPFGRPIELRELAKELGKNPPPGTYRTAIQNAAQDLVDGSLEACEREMETLSSRLKTLQTASVNLKALKEVVHTPLP